MRWFFALWLALLPTSVRAEPLVFLICQPGGLELAPEQLQVIDKLYRYLEKKLGLADGQISGRYLNEWDACRKALRDKPAVVMPALPLFLETQAEVGMVPVARVQIEGLADSHYHLMVKKGSATDLASLRNQKLTGTSLDSRRFVADLVLEGQLGPPEALQLAPERLGLRAIRAVTKGEVPAVLLDDAQFRALAGTRYASELVEIRRSGKLPNPPVAVVPSRVPDGFGARLAGALVDMANDPAGRPLLDVFRVDGFVAAGPEAYAAALGRLGESRR